MPTRAWASLPAIQRTAGEMPLVAAPGRFVQRLPGSTGLPPIVQPLGHEVSPLATPGLVVARTRAIEAPAHGAIPAPAPVPRRASRTAGTDLEAEAVETFHDSTRDSGAPVETGMPIAAPPPASPAPAPIRTMPTVSRLAIRVPERPLTSAAVAARPAPVQRATSTAASDADASALPRPSGGMRRVPSAAPAAPVVSREVAPPLPAVTPAPSPAEPALAGPGGGTRRGLGAPVQSAPTTARPVASVLAGPVVSRSTTSGPIPIAASNLRPVAQRSADGGRQSLPALSSGVPEPVAGRGDIAELPELRLPHLPVQRSGDASSRPPVALATPAATPAPAATSPEIRPTAGANPLRPALGIQRLASDGLDEQAPANELPSPWWSPAAAPGSDMAASHAAVPGLGGPSAGPIAASVQRSAVDTSTAPAIATIAPRGADRSRPAQATRSAPVAPPVQRIVTPALRPSALPQPVGAGRHGATVAASVVESLPVATAPSSGREIGGGPVIQRTSAGAAAPPVPAPAPAVSGGPAVIQREEGGAPAAPAPSSTGAPSERDLDELAQALFGRIRGRLRNDLIYDREAKGLTFDNV